MSQEPFDRPSVAGWAGGRSWINPATLLERANFAKRVLFPEPEPNRNKGSYNFQYRCDRGGCVDLSGIAPEIANMEMPDDARRRRSQARAAARAAAAADPATSAAYVDTEDDEVPILDAGLAVDLLTDAGVRAANPELQQEKEGWNIGYASTVGAAMARQFSPTIPLTIAKVDLVAMVREAGLTEADEVADYFIHRFLRIPLSESRRQIIVDVLKGGIGMGAIDFSQPNLETALREALHVLMGMSEYQLG